MTLAAVIGAAGSLVSGLATYQQSKYQAAVATANARQARLNAKQVVDVAYSDLEDLGAENQGRQGMQAAQMGGSGLSVSSPSFNQARARGRQLNIIEHRRTIETAYREAANYRTQANVYNTEASAARSAGKFSLIGGFLGAAGSIAGGIEGQPSGGSEPINVLGNRRSQGNVYYNPDTYRRRRWGPYHNTSYGPGFSTGY